MTSHAYPAATLIGDYGRAGLGLAFVVPPLFIISPVQVVGAACLGLAALFAAFAGRTLLRQLAPIEMDEAGIGAGGLLPLRLEWAALEDLGVHYYATRRDREGGWMQLVLRAEGCRLRLDSRIAGFQSIAARAARAAEARRLHLSPITIANLAALGLAIEGTDAAIEGAR
ncbi:MAG TPA: hypothetical protein VGU20_32360 [Stellaceae bacterium]|nr:hypothetical protein [Stellaceae bacterium]